MFEDQGRRGIIFASEIKAILASGLVKPRLNRDALSHYLQYLYVHPGQTIYENVHTLPPAHTMIWRDGEAKVRRYWSPPPQREEIRLDSAVEEFRSLFKQAVARQFVADVPVGAFLSGGLDSSTVVAVGAKLKPDCRRSRLNLPRGAWTNWSMPTRWQRCMGPLTTFWMIPKPTWRV